MPEGDSFNSNEGQPAPEAQLDTNSFLDQLVGEGKKFANIEDLAKGKLNSDEHIDKLENENQRLRQELDTRMTAEEVLAEIRKPEANLQPQAQPSGGDTAPQLNKDDLLGFYYFYEIASKIHDMYPCEIG